MQSIFYYPMAFAGGLVLNVMPCVLPVLTMKVFHLVEQRDVSAREKRTHGLSYGAGVLATFMVLGGALVTLQLAGSSVGWGIAFGEPRFVAALATVIFVFALNALGVFEFTVSVHHGARGGWAGSFMNGVVASLMSTPCSGPFLGTAAGFALGGAAPWETLLIFACIGAGLAFPFVLFSFVPGAGRLLPRPGLWMETFKQVMGFSLIATTAWLFGSLLRQVTPEAARGFVYFLVAVSVACWLVGRYGSAIHETVQRRVTRLAATLIAVGALVGFVDLEKASLTSVRGDLAGPVVVDEKIAWRSFDSALVYESLAAGRPVFMDFTADWCMNCKANERLFIETPQVREVLERTQIIPMKADLTVENDEIRAWLEPFPYSGIPVYVIYLPDETYDLLPQTITTELLVRRLGQAGERFPTE